MLMIVAAAVVSTGALCLAVLLSFGRSLFTVLWNGLRAPADRIADAGMTVLAAGIGTLVIYRVHLLLLATPPSWPEAAPVAIGFLLIGAGLSLWVVGKAKQKSERTARRAAASLLLCLASGMAAGVVIVLGR